MAAVATQAIANANGNADTILAIVRAAVLAAPDSAVAITTAAIRAAGSEMAAQIASIAAGVVPAKAIEIGVAAAKVAPGKSLAIAAAVRVAADAIQLLIIEGHGFPADRNIRQTSSEAQVNSYQTQQQINDVVSRNQ